MLVICVSSFTLCLLSSPGEAVSCPCFRGDTRRSSLGEATGHWPAAVQPEIGSQITSLKPNRQTRTNCVWILSRLWEIEEVCSQAFHSGNTSSPCPLSMEKARLKSEYAHLCVLLCVCLSRSTKDSKRWKASPPDPLCLRPNNMMSRTPSAGNQEHPPPSWWAPGLLLEILQSIRQRNRDGEHAACSAWDSSRYAWGPHIQSHEAARVARTAWQE